MIYEMVKTAANYLEQTMGVDVYYFPEENTFSVYSQSIIQQGNTLDGLPSSDTAISLFKKCRNAHLMSEGIDVDELTSPYIYLTGVDLNIVACCVHDDEIRIVLCMDAIKGMLDVANAGEDAGELLLPLSQYLLNGLRIMKNNRIKAPERKEWKKLGEAVDKVLGGLPALRKEVEDEDDDYYEGEEDPDGLHFS